MLCSSIEGAKSVQQFIVVLTVEVLCPAEQGGSVYRTLESPRQGCEQALRCLIARRDGGLQKTDIVAGRGRQ